MPKSMLSTVHTLLVKEGKYLFSNNSFYDFTDHRGQGIRTIISWDSFIARLVNRNNNSPELLWSLERARVWLQL